VPLTTIQRPIQMIFLVSQFYMDVLILLHLTTIPRPTQTTAIALQPIAVVQILQH
jgi:hypothetical protein